MITYTFSGITFSRLVSGDTPRWFPSRVEYTRDLVLDSAEDYLDIGATTTELLIIRAALTDANDRDDLIDLVGTTATLSNTAGRSATATLISATPLNINSATYAAAELTFVRRP